MSKDFTPQIPRDILYSAQIRILETQEEKAASIKYYHGNLSLAAICRELKADYTKAYRRLQALKEGRTWGGVGRPRLVDEEAIDETNRIIARKFKNGDSADYETIRDTLEKHYKKKLGAMTPETREKYPTSLRKNYVYEVGSRLDFNTAKPTLAEKDRNECSTTETVHYFFEHVFTKELCE